MEVFNISGSAFLPTYQMANMTADYFGLDKSLIIKASADKFSQPAKRPRRTGFGISKAEMILDYLPYSFAEVFRIIESQFSNP